MAIEILNECPQKGFISTGKNYHTTEPTEELKNFCGQDVLDKLDSQLRERNTSNTMVCFKKDDGKIYRVWKGIGTRKGYNIYVYNGDKINQSSNAKKQSEKLQKKNPIRTTPQQPWIPSKRAVNYIMPNNHFDYLGNLGKLVDYSYFECEKTIIDEYNQGVSDEYRIFLCAFSDYGLHGNIDNSICLFCLLNSGFEDNTEENMSDIDAYEDPEIRKLIDKIRSGKIKAHIGMTEEAYKIKRNGLNYPFVSWIRSKCTGNTSPGREWLLDFIKQISKKTNDTDAFDWLSKYFAMRDFFYYHSHRANNSRWKSACQKITGKKLAPHQQHVISEVKQAMKNNVPIILSRTTGDWIEFLPDLKKYPLLFCGTSIAAFLSSNNIIHFNDRKKKLQGNDLTIAKEKAWKDLKSAMVARLNSLRETSK